VVNVIPIAVTGFVVMLACSMWAVTSYRRMTGSTIGRAPATGGGPGKKRVRADRSQVNVNRSGVARGGFVTHRAGRLLQRANQAADSKSASGGLPPDAGGQVFRGG
jgi:hypothetical protein